MTDFEMLWDCSSCGTQKLLGKSHRRCANCGAPQDETKRYFPKPGEEIEATGHKYVGADWHCAACTTPNSNAAAFCTNCGNPHEGNAAVKLAADRLVKDNVLLAAAGSLGDTPGPPGTPVKKEAFRLGRLPLVVAVVTALVVGFILVAMFWHKGESVRVEGHRWSREIDIERLDPRIDSAWCDSMPSGAYNVSRSREQRGTHQIPDGQDCHDRQVDNGDGTFHKKNECTARTKSEPVYDDKCRFTIDRWSVQHTAHADGRGVSPGPQWPGVNITRSGSCLGCEREGARREKLIVDVVDPAQKKIACDVDEGRWRALVDGVNAPMEVRVITGGAVCSSLRAP